MKHVSLKVSNKLRLNYPFPQGDLNTMTDSWSYTFCRLVAKYFSPSRHLSNSRRKSVRRLVRR